MKFELSPEAEAKRRAAAFTQLGIDLHDRGRYGDAIILFDRALELEPDLVRAIRGKALCLSQLGRAQEALAYAERAVELARYPGLAYSTLGLVLHRLGRREEAQEAFCRGMEYTPDDYRVYYNFACYWAEVADEAKCRQFLELALELAPDSFGQETLVDPDLARYSREKWFTDLVAIHRSRAATWRPGGGTAR